VDAFSNASFAEQTLSVLWERSQPVLAEIEMAQLRQRIVLEHACNLDFAGGMGEDVVVPLCCVAGLVTDGNLRLLQRHGQSLRPFRHVGSRVLQ
jgi:hypothetical protein